MTDMDHRPTTKLARRYSWQTLLAFTVPSVLMQVGFSLTTTGDSMISSRMISTTALAAVSICIPLIYVEDALAAMFGAGGCAVIGRLLGEGRIDRARSALSDLVIFAVAAGLVWAGLIYGLRAPLLHLLGANDELFPLSMQYLELHARFAALFVLQRMFALLLIVAGMAGLNLALTIAAALAQLGGDLLFVGVLHMGIQGPALAAGIGTLITAIGGILALARRGKALRFGRPRFDVRGFGRMCVVGGGDFVQSLSMGLIIALYNITAARWYGTGGVAAITILTALQWLFFCGVYGYVKGVAPVISYHLGTRARSEVLRYIRMGVATAAGLGVALDALAQLVARPVLSVYAPPDSPVFGLAHGHFALFMLSVPLMAVGTAMNSAMGALGEGPRATAHSLTKSVALPVLLILVLPPLTQGAGMWVIAPVAEALGCLVGAGLLRAGIRSMDRRLAAAPEPDAGPTPSATPQALPDHS